MPKETPYHGIALMIGFALCMVLCDSIAKSLSQTNVVINIVWYRYLFHTITLGLILNIYVFRKKQTEKIGSYSAQLLRGLILIASSLLFFHSIAVMPLAEALSLMYIFPIIAVWLSVLFLKEKLSVSQHFFIVIGFIGVILVLNPTSTNHLKPGFHALIAGCLMGAYIFATKIIATKSTPLISSFIAGIIGILIIPMLPNFDWILFSRNDLLLSALMGAFAALGHFCMFLSMQVAKASYVSPFAFIEILFATAISYFWFNDAVTTIGIIGISLIMICGVLFAKSQRD